MFWGSPLDLGVFGEQAQAFGGGLGAGDDARDHGSFDQGGPGEFGCVDDGFTGGVPAW